MGWSRLPQQQWFLSRPRVGVAWALLVLLLLYVSLHTSHKRVLQYYIPSTSTMRSYTDPCASIKELRKEIGLPQTFQYGKRTIKTRPTKRSTSRKDLIQRHESLMPSFTLVTQEMCLEGTQARDQALQALHQDSDELHLDYSPNPFHGADTSILLIGASTTLARLEEALPQMQRWLSNTHVSLVVQIADSNHNQARMHSLQTLARIAGIDATLLPNADPEPDAPGARFGYRHFSLVKHLQRQRQPTHRWFAMIDDDTFFPSLEAVVAALEQYDPNKPFYIGALTENSNAMSDWGYMAYGGAGVFLSAAVLDAIHKNYDACLPQSSSRIPMEGDVILAQCIYDYMSPPVQLTVLPGLHQVDLRGDASGWFEAGVEPVLSLHHWNATEWYIFPAHLGSLVSDICGVSCFLQRYQFADSAILTNGYSIAQYPIGLENIDLGRVEDTFLESAKGTYQFNHMFGRLRPRLNASEKVSWRLEHSIEAGNTVRQFYVRRAGNETADAVRPKREVLGVLELEWR